MELVNSFYIEKFNPEVLREYDIRGIVEKDINQNTAYTIGRIFGHIVSNRFNEKSIVVGYDGRNTSPNLQKALCEGLIESGSNVKNIGLCPTPMTYYAHHFLNTNAAIMVTGSHNPSEYNGFKMVLDKNPFYSKDIQNFKNLADDNKLIKGKGKLESIDIKNHYIDRNLEYINF